MFETMSVGFSCPVDFTHISKICKLDCFDIISIEGSEGVKSSFVTLKKKRKKRLVIVRGILMSCIC